MQQYDGHFGDWLRASLSDAGMTQAELSEQAGITENSISGYVNGVHIPNLRTLSLIVGVIPGASWAVAIDAIRADLDIGRDTGCLAGELLL